VKIGRQSRERIKFCHERKGQLIDTTCVRRRPLQTCNNKSQNDSTIEKRRRPGLNFCHHENRAFLTSTQYMFRITEPCMRFHHSGLLKLGLSRKDTRYVRLAPQ
ncbi:hypothetical protein PV326_012244, partial [Microctonus aethiopoides]